MRTFFSVWTSTLTFPALFNGLNTTHVRKDIFTGKRKETYPIPPSALDAIYQVDMTVDPYYAFSLD